LSSVADNPNSKERIGASAQISQLDEDLPL
jgi:hypothetical protein